LERVRFGMSVIPRIAPIIGDPQAAQRLSARWQRARSLLLISSVALPLALTLVCVSFAGLTAFGPGEDRIGWSVIPVLAAGACAVSLVVWLRQDGLTDPESWVPATVLMTVSELVLGVFPGFGLTARYATGLAAKALLAIGVLGAGAAWATARLARHCLVGSPVPELGSTEFRLVLGNKPTRLVIETDRVEWTTRQGRSRLEAGVRFTQLHGISTTHDNAVVLHTSAGRWTVPVADAALTRDLLQRRKAWWDKHVDALVEREREVYRDMIRMLEPAKGGIATPIGEAGAG
jgi:hypothetical protein